MVVGKNNTIYNEVYTFLNILGKEYLDKIPSNIYERIKKERIPNYNIKINYDENIADQISEDALAFISYLNLKYWATEEEKEELMKIYAQNDEKAEKLKKRYDPYTILKNREKANNKLQAENKN